MAPMAHKSKSHTHSMRWVMKLREQGREQKEIKEGSWRRCSAPTSTERAPSHGSNPCWGTCSSTSPSILSWWFQGPSAWPNADPPCPEFELSKKRSSFSKHDEKHKVRNYELSRSDVSSHGEETGPQSGRMTNPTTRNKEEDVWGWVSEDKSLWNGREDSLTLLSLIMQVKVQTLTYHCRSV